MAKNQSASTVPPSREASTPAGTGPLSRDLADAETYGASGTPMFFVNGRLVSGAQPFAVFAKVIEEEQKGKAGGRGGSKP